MGASTFSKSANAFAMTCRVDVDISASPEDVWRLLADAKSFPRWNSTVTRIDGDIRDGERLSIHVPGTARTFTPRVSEVVPAQRMTWSDGIVGVFKGVRTFVLEPRERGATHFTMEERFSGVMFALVKGMLPDFRPIFEAYADDLKREAERISSGSP